MDWIFNHALITAFREWCSNQPPVYDKESGNTYNFDADMFVNDCLTEHVGIKHELVVSLQQSIEALTNFGQGFFITKIKNLKNRRFFKN